MNTKLQIIVAMLEKHPKQSIAQIEQLDAESIKRLISTLPSNIGRQILEQINNSKVIQVVEIMDRASSAKLFESMEPRTCNSMLRLFESSLRSDLLGGMEKETSSKLEKNLSYPENTVGAVTDSFILTLTNDLTAGQAIDIIGNSQLRLSPQTIVLSRDCSIIGYVDIRKLLSIDPEKPINQITQETNEQILADMDRESQLENWEFSLLDVPVVDLDGLFLGVVSKETLAKRKAVSSRNAAGKTASMALGDLYRVGLSGLFYGSEVPNEKEN